MAQAADLAHAVEMRSIVKQFPGVLAIDNIDFDLRVGEIHALLGENGAGKSTLMNVLAGLYRADDGSVRIHGQLVDLRSPRDAIERGVGMVHQHLCWCPHKPSLRTSCWAWTNRTFSCAWPNTTAK